MIIRGVRHRGLLRFLEYNDARGLQPDLVRRLRAVLTGLSTATAIADLRGPPGWRLHQLTGNRARTWSISVSGNWRLTFDIEDGEVRNLDLEDYH